MERLVDAPRLLEPLGRSRGPAPQAEIRTSLARSASEPPAREDMAAKVVGMASVDHRMPAGGMRPVIVTEQTNANIWPALARVDR